MNRPKIWQVVIIIAAVGALGFAAFSLFTGGKPKINHERMLVDVGTGELWAVPVSVGPLMLPAKHPESGERQLWPVEEDSGRYRISDRHFSGFLEMGKQAAGDGVVDLKTAAVSVTNTGSPKVYRKRKQ